MTSSRARTGFTLLEVLAAVLVMGLLFTVLARTAMQGLRSEGTDRRRAEAGLIADSELAEIEARLAGGFPLEIGRTEREAEPYLVTLEVIPEDVKAMLSLAPTAGAPDPRQESLEALLTADDGTDRVQQVIVAVSWEEAGDTMSVSRTTYAFDASGLEALLPAPGENGGVEDLLEGAGEAGAGAGGPPSDLQQLIQQFEAVQ